MLNRRAQSLIEYALIFAAITAASVAMGTYTRRSMNAKLERSAVGLNAVFTDINTMPVPAVAIPPESVDDLTPVPTVVSPTLDTLRDLVNRIDFATGLDLLSQAQNALVRGEITEGRDLLNQALALFNGIDFSWLRAVYGYMDASIPGVSEINAGISEFERGIAAANETLSLLDQQLDPNRGILDPIGGIIVPGVGVPYLNLNDALNSLSNAINALSNAKDLLNRGIDLMEESMQYAQ